MNVLIGGKQRSVGNVMGMMLNTCWAERDVGEVEVAHLLLKEPLVSCTRQFVTTSLSGGLTLKEKNPKHLARAAPADGSKEAFAGVQEICCISQPFRSLETVVARPSKVEVVCREARMF